MDYINPSDMKAADINSDYLGVGFARLMENAGAAIAEEMIRLLEGKDKKVAIICGPGNNGGDGFSAAIHLLDKGIKPAVYLIGGPEEIRTRESKKAYKALIDRGCPVSRMNSPTDVDTTSNIIVDAMVGTGAKGALREPYRSIVRAINQSHAYKVSVDVPTGLGTDTWVDADLVIALHKAKVGTQKFNTTVKDIGIPAEAEEYVGPGDLLVNLGRRADSHKGENGRVLIIGGSIEYHGAPILAAYGALHSGADLVTLCVPDSIGNVVRSGNPDLMVRTFEGDYLSEGSAHTIRYLIPGMDAIVIGPGLGMNRIVKKGLEAFFQLKPTSPMVIDADALNQLDHRMLENLDTVVTPHKGEFTRLTGVDMVSNPDKRKELIRRWAEKLNTTILLKSPIDIIASEDGRVRLNKTGNPGMTVGGTGDVLAGVVGGFLSMGFPLFEAACSGAFVNGTAGDNLYKFKGYGYTASDITKELPYTIKRLIDLYP